MLVYALLAVCTVMAALVTCCRVGGLRKWLGYSVICDMAFTAALLVAFRGSFDGLIVATLAGLFMALLLSALKKLVGYERLTLRRYRPVWQAYPPVWRDLSARLSAMTAAPA